TLPAPPGKKLTPDVWVDGRENWRRTPLSSSQRSRMPVLGFTIASKPPSGENAKSLEIICSILESVHIISESKKLFLLIPLGTSHKARTRSAVRIASFRPSRDSTARKISLCV